MRVLMHSIVWQYLPNDTQNRIETAMMKAAAQISESTPLAWVSLETDRALMQHQLSIRSWPDHGETQNLGFAHAHGFWMDWRG